MPFRLPIFWGKKTPPAPASDLAEQSVLWTAWHTAGLFITVVDLGLGTALFLLHTSISTILALLGGIQAMALGLIGGLYQLTSKKSL